MVGQVGGLSRHKRPILVLKPDYVLKPLQLDHRGVRELAFYEALNEASHTQGIKAYANFTSVKGRKEPGLIDIVSFSVALLLGDPYALSCEQRILAAWDAVEREAKLLQRLYRFVPAYFGMVRHEISTGISSDDTYKANTSAYGIELDCHLLLNDVTINFRHACVMDIKMGTETFEPDASSAKKEREMAKYPQQTEFGFRVAGNRVHLPTHANADKNGYVYCRKDVGRSLATKKDVKRCFVEFLGLEGLDSSVLPARLRVITKILLELRSLQHWFRDNRSFRFFASSLLIAYEGDTKRTESLDMVNVKMIDFCHVRRKSGGDKGYLKGLTTLVSLLEEISMEWEEKARQRE